MRARALAHFLSLSPKVLDFLRSGIAGSRKFRYPAHWKEGKYQVSRESVSSTWLVGWESWYLPLPLPACFAKVRLLFVVLFINLGAETIFQLTRPTKPWFHCVSGCYCANIQPKKYSHSENIHSRKIFTPEKHSALIMHKIVYLSLSLSLSADFRNVPFSIINVSLVQIELKLDLGFSNLLLDSSSPLLASSLSEKMATSVVASLLCSS